MKLVPETANGLEIILYEGFFPRPNTFKYLTELCGCHITKVLVTRLRNGENRVQFFGYDKQTTRRLLASEML